MSFIKKIIGCIKKVFIRNNDSKNNYKSETNENQTINYQKLYDSINVGDIIRAKRYSTEEEKSLIPEGHREGPFIVLKKEDKDLICAQGTSVVPYAEYYDFYFYLNNECYSLNKSTYFKLNKLEFINEFSLINVIDALKEKDLNDLFRQIKISHRSYYGKMGEKFELNLPLQVGDIIDYVSQTFIIIDVDETNITCAPLKNNINYKNDSELTFNNLNNINYSKTICIELNDKIRYINTVNNQCLKNILNKWQEYINNCKNINITQRGSIIVKNNEYYYVYGEEGQEWLTFEIIKERRENFEKIKIGDFEYYTKYKNLTINKKDLFTNIYLCTEKEKDEIKQRRKNYKEIEKNINIYGTPIPNNFNIGDIIENRNYSNKKYIIIGMHKKTFECLNIKDLKKAIYNPILIKKSDCKLLKNFSIKGIKWLEEHPDFKFTRIGDKEILEAIFKTQSEFIKKSQNTEQINPILEVMSTYEENNNIKLNTSVKTNEFSEEVFVVREILGDILVCVSSLDLGKINPIKHYLNKDNVIIVKEKQKRK